MGHTEDFIYDIFEVLEKEQLKELFYKQLEKMKWQEKHRYNSLRENYEYAFNKIIKNYKNKK